MKKTLITLLALAGVAAAGVVEDWTATFTTDNVAATQTHENYKAEFVTSDSPLTLTITGMVLNNSGQNQANGSYSAVSPGTSHNTAFRPNANIGNGASYTLNFTLTNQSEEDIDLTSISVDAFVYASNGNFHNDVTRDFSLTLAGAGFSSITEIQKIVIPQTNSQTYDNTTAVELSFGSPIFIGSGKSLDFTLSVAQESAAGTFVGLKGATFSIIPEPATATLSLLALCGLAARRRRS